MPTVPTPGRLTRAPRRAHLSSAWGGSTSSDATIDRSATTLSAIGRGARLAVAAIGLLVLLAGTLLGQDDDFPFGPFRMYATRDDPNGVVRQAVVQAISPSGRVSDVTDTGGAPRRAELEGEMSAFQSHPETFDQIAPAYLTGRGAPVKAVRLVWRAFPLHDGRSGAPVDTVIASWTVPR